MTKQIITRFSLVLVMVLGFIACSPNTEYAKVIPSDASVVSAIDFASLYKKGDLGSKENKEILDELKQSILNSSNIKDTESLKKILDDPSASGIDLQAPAYIFFKLTEEPRVGVVMRVSSRSKASDYLKALAKEVEGQVASADGGVEYIQFPRMMLLLNDESFVFYAHTEDEGLGNAQEALALFSLTEDKQFIKTNRFAEMNKQKADLALYWNYNEFMKFTAKNGDSSDDFDKEVVKSFDEMYKDFNAVNHLNFEKGKVTFDTRFFSEDKETLEWFRLAEESFQAPKGSFFKHIDKNAYIVANMGVKPTEGYIQKIMNQLLFKVVSEALDKYGMKMESLLRAFHGDFTAYLNGFNAVDVSADYGIYAGLSDGSALIRELDGLVARFDTMNAVNDSLDKVAPEYYEWSDGEVQKYRPRLPKVKVLGVGEYLFSEGDDTWESKLMIKDNVLSFIPTKSVGKAEPKEDITKASFGSELNKYTTCFAINLESILKNPGIKAVSAFLPSAAQGAMEELSTIFAYSDATTKSHFELRLKTDKENSFKIIVDLLRDLY